MKKSNVKGYYSSISKQSAIDTERSICRSINKALKFFGIQNVKVEPWRAEGSLTDNITIAYTFDGTEYPLIKVIK